MKGCNHKFVDSTCCLKCGWEPSTVSLSGDIGTCIFRDGGEYEVWVGPAGDLRNGNVINAFVAGVGDTRDEAVADAVKELKAVVAGLQTEEQYGERGHR